MKIRIHPLFIIVAAVTVISTGVSVFLSSLTAVLLHELAHAYAARSRGYVADNILFLPYGAVLYNRDNTDKLSNVIITLAGPLSNFLISLIFISLWWLIPSSYPVTEDFVNANIFIGLFNLLPVWPLDGGRLIFTLAGYRPRAMKLLKICAVVLSVILFILFGLSVKYGINFSILIMAVFLLSGAFANTDKEYFLYLNNRSPAVKDYDGGVTETTVMISSQATLKKTLLMIKPDRFITFKITENGRVIRTVSEMEMREIFNTHKLNEKLSDVIPR